LHSHNGPYYEAWNLYVKHSRVLDRKGHCCVYDLGLGCGAQVIAMRDAFHQNSNLTSFEIISFDLEKQGLKALLENIESFDYALPHRDFLSAAIASDCVEEKNFRWRFVKGDFVETAFTGDLPKANVIC